MAESTTQSFENHARIVPAYHYGAFGIFAVNLVWALYKMVRYFSFWSVMDVLVAVGLLLLFFYARIFALTVQDRLIRLEMRLRLAGLLAPDLQPRINEITVKQLIALRFASDAELPDLARQVLDGTLTAPKDIKRSIRQWQPDLLRA